MHKRDFDGQNAAFFARDGGHAGIAEIPGMPEAAAAIPEERATATLLRKAFSLKLSGKAVVKKPAKGKGKKKKK